MPNPTENSPLNNPGRPSSEARETDFEKITQRAEEQEEAEVEQITPEEKFDNVAKEYDALSKELDDLRQKRKEEYGKEYDETANKLKLEGLDPAVLDVRLKALALKNKELLQQMNNLEDKLAKAESTILSLAKSDIEKEEADIIEKSKLADDLKDVVRHWKQTKESGNQKMIEDAVTDFHKMRIELLTKTRQEEENALFEAEKNEESKKIGILKKMLIRTRQELNKARQDLNNPDFNLDLEEHTVV